jgi:hypothetical protein
MALIARLHQDVRALEWHRWTGTTSAVVNIGAALVGAGHLDARLEGADFLRP